MSGRATHGLFIDAEEVGRRGQERSLQLAPKYSCLPGTATSSSSYHPALWNWIARVSDLGGDK